MLLRSRGYKDQEERPEIVPPPGGHTSNPHPAVIEGRRGATVMEGERKSGARRDRARRVQKPPPSDKIRPFLDDGYDIVILS